MPGLSAVDEERIRQTRLVLFAAHVSTAGAFVAAQHGAFLFVWMRTTRASIVVRLQCRHIGAIRCRGAITIAKSSMSGSR